MGRAMPSARPGMKIARDTFRPVPSDDAALLREWRAGSRKSGEVLFHRYYDLLSRYFNHKAPEAFEDLVQATFRACVEKVDQLREAASFRAFLLGIARFELMHHYRRKSKREDLHDFGEVSLHDLGPSPSRVVAASEEQRLLLEALRQIPIDLQIVVELSYWEKFTGPEIADVLGIPEGTVRSRLRRARERLEAKLTELSESPTLLHSTMANLEQWAFGVRDKLGRA